MPFPVIDWQRATLVGALLGGVFWGLAAGVILTSKASAWAVVAICVAAAVVMTVGAFMYRLGSGAHRRADGIGTVLAPLTGVAPVLAVWIPGLLTQAISWKA